MAKTKGHEEGETLTRKRAQLKTPRMHRVLLHNDHYTTMEFVVFVLERVFRKDEAEAKAIMLAVHKQGLGVAGIYTKDIAETKAAQARTMAEREGFPLRCTTEPEG